jgi:hypothetical protein
VGVGEEVPVLLPAIALRSANQFDGKIIRAEGAHRLHVLAGEGSHEFLDDLRRRSVEPRGRAPCVEPAARAGERRFHRADAGA